MYQETNKKSVTAILVLIVSFLFFAAMLTVLSPCGPKEDGTFMSCHYAGRALRILSGAAVVVAAAAFFRKELARLADIVLALLGLAVIVIPGGVIHLCMMPEMKCRAVMKPGAIVFAVLLIAAAAADLLLRNRGR